MVWRKQFFPIDISDISVSQRCGDPQRVIGDVTYRNVIATILEHKRTLPLAN